MIIHSPIHSFVDFEERLELFNLPVVDMYRPEFQCLFESGSVGWDDVLKLQIVSADRSTVLVDLDPAVGVITNTCSWCTIAGIPINSDAYPLVVNANNIIPAGTYASYQALSDAFMLQGLNANGGQFLHCCGHGEVNHYDITTAAGTITVDFTKGLQYITFITDVDHPGLFDPIVVNSCFRYCIYNQTQEERIYSNLFVRKPDARHLMVVEYSSNEDSYDFKYPTGVQNVVYLPMKVRNPQYPEKRKVYKKSNQHYKVLSASIEKEYELITDYLPDLLHDRITVMLAHDNLFFSADNINSQVAKREGDDYSIDWPSDIIWLNDRPSGPGKGKISVPFEGRNSNCEKRPACTFTPIDPGDQSCPVVINLVASFHDGAYYFSFGNPGGEATNATFTVMLLRPNPDNPDGRLLLDSIEVNGNGTITGTLTPFLGYDATDFVEVVTNCTSGEHSSGVDATPLFQEHNTTVNNSISSASIEDIVYNSAVCTPYTGFPVTNGNSGTAVIPTGITSAITVRFNTTPAGPVVLQLQINGSTVETKTVTTPTSIVIITDNSYTINPGDDITINIS